MEKEQNTQTEGEAIETQVKAGTQPTEHKPELYINLLDHMPNLTVTRQRITKHKDKKEKETGIFHWMFKGGRYEAVDELKEERLNLCADHCIKKMNSLQNYIEVLFDQMCGWQYRLEQLEAEAERRGIELSINKELKEEDQPEIVE